MASWCKQGKFMNKSTSILRFLFLLSALLLTGCYSSSNNKTTESLIDKIDIIPSNWLPASSQKVEQMSKTESVKTSKGMTLAQKCKNAMGYPLNKTVITVGSVFKPNLVDDYCTWFSWDNRDNVIKGKMMGCGLKSIDAVKIHIEGTSKSGKKSIQLYKCGFTSEGHILKSIVKTR